MVSAIEMNKYDTINTIQCYAAICHVTFDIIRDDSVNVPDD